MKSLKRRVVGLELACRSTRSVEWLPGWHRVYPRCFFARLSSRLDYRWQAGRWPVHEEEGVDAWEEWFLNLPAGELSKGHWHAW